MRLGKRHLGTSLVALGLAGSVIAAGGAAQAFDPSPFPPGGVSLWHDEPNLDPSGSAIDLLRDAKGDIWYVDGGNEDLVRIDAHTHAQTSFDLPSTSRVLAMAAAPDGSIWFSDNWTNSIGVLDPATGALRSYPLTGLPTVPSSMVFGADGNLWFGDWVLNDLVKMDSTGAITTMPEPSGNPINALVAGPDGRIWYTRNGPDGLAALDPITGVVTGMGVAIHAGRNIAVSMSGDIWLGGVNQFMKVTTAGIVKSYRVIPAGATPVVPVEMVGGSTSEIHFLDQTYGFGTIDATGAVHFSRLDGQRTAIERDGEGHIWVNEAWTASLNWN